MCPSHWTNEEGRPYPGSDSFALPRYRSSKNIHHSASDHETLDEDKEALENYFAPKKNVVSERHKIRSDPIRSGRQTPEETIDTYLTALRELKAKAS